MNRVQLKLIEEIEENESQLTDWERKFIDDIQKNDYTLTTNQSHKINQIHHRVVFG